MRAQEQGMEEIIEEVIGTIIGAVAVEIAEEKIARSIELIAGMIRIEGAGIKSNKKQKKRNE